MKVISNLLYLPTGIPISALFLATMKNIFAFLENIPHFRAPDQFDYIAQGSPVNDSGERDDGPGPEFRGIDSYRPAAYVSCMQPVPRPLQGMLIAAGMIISWCSALLKRPEVSVRGIALSSLSLSELSFDVNFLVNNPNSFKIPLKSFSFDVFYEDGRSLVQLSHGEKGGIRIEPGENEIVVPVTVRNAELIRSLAGLITKGKVTLRIRGTASPDFYGIAPDLPFTYVTTLAR